MREANTTDRARILIVEDDATLAEMLTTYFSVQDYEAHVAASGEEALRLARTYPPDLVMLDIRLPDIDGYEVCRQLRAQRATERTPMLFLTEKRDRTDRLQGLELGVVDYITKPFDMHELMLRVRNTLARAKRPALNNPVTDMPEGPAVDEHLEALAYGLDSTWVALALLVEGLATFRERYGFVAADDVLRALALMVRGAVREYGTPDDFMGHLGTDQFVVVTPAAHAAKVRDRIVERVAQSAAYFYPIQDRDEADALGGGMLRVQTRQVSASDGPFDGVAALRAALTTAS